MLSPRGWQVQVWHGHSDRLLMGKAEIVVPHIRKCLGVLLSVDTTEVFTGCIAPESL